MGILKVYYELALVEHILNPSTMWQRQVDL